MPPVSRPSMRTMNLKSSDGWLCALCACVIQLGKKNTDFHPLGQPFVVEDSITVDYQSILTAANTLRNTLDRTIMWQRYMHHSTHQRERERDVVCGMQMDVHMAIKRSWWCVCVYVYNVQHHQKRIERLMLDLCVCYDCHPLEGGCDRRKL